MVFKLPPLPYELHALEPYVSAKTLDKHHGQHHNTYINNLNNLIQNTQLAEKTMDEIITITHNNEAKRAIFNNAAQAFNHEFYFSSMAPNGGGKPHEELLRMIVDQFGSYEQFYQLFKTTGTELFGSGWVWLVIEEGRLQIVPTFNADTPIVHNQTPLIAMDVWEHAYYLDYANRRLNYISIFLDNLVNWSFAESNMLAKQ